MKSREDFRRAFGQADAAFEQNIHWTLDALKAQEGEKYMKKKLRMTTAIAIAAVLVLATAAFAATNSIGILDLLSDTLASKPKVLPEATKIVESDIAQEGGNTGDAQFSVREAIYDGMYLYMTVAVRPMDGKTLLLGVDSDPSMPVSDFQADWIEEDGNILAWADSKGYERLLNTNVHSHSETLFTSSYDYRLEPDGTLLYLIEGAVESEPQVLDVTLTCETMPYTQKSATEYSCDYDARKTAELTFSIESSGHFAGKESYEPIDIPEMGVRVTGVRLYATSITVYTEILFEITDIDAYNALDVAYFYFVDDEGNELPDGVLSWGGCEPVDEKYRTGEVAYENGTRFIQRDDLQATEQLPDSLRLAIWIPGEGPLPNTYEVRFPE